MAADGETRWLLLVPTQYEMDLLKQSLSLPKLPSVVDRVVGFGPIVSAVRATNLVTEIQPQHVILAGIAGGFTLMPGEARAFSRVGIDGIGAGEGNQFQTAHRLGWSFGNDQDELEFPETIELETEWVRSMIDSNTVADGQLLTVCRAAEGRAMTIQRQSRFPNVIAEDMESYPVALACQRRRVPLTVIRGISNQAGDRNVGNWKVKPALNAVAEIVQSLIQEDR